MRYVVLLACDPGDWQAAPSEVQQEYSAAHRAFEDYVDAHGRRLGSAVLAGGDTATTIRHGAGGAVVGDGPLVESAEQVAGYYDVELPDLDAAIAAGRLLPSAYAVEIRPVVTFAGHGPT